MKPNQDSDAVIYIVDDDQAIRHAMGLLMQSVGLKCEIFESADDFLNDHTNERSGCLVLDIRMPGMGGLELQETLHGLDCTLPIIFITGHGDIPMAVEAMQKGAFDFIQKPFRDQELLDRIHVALKTEQEERSRRRQQSFVRSKLDRLTTREHEVFNLVVTGKPNKIIAHELGVSQRTVEIHRARVMEKMEAKSLADLVRMQLTS